MRPELPIGRLRFSAAGSAEQASGLIGWVQFEYGDALDLDGVAVRRTLDGRLCLSFPARRDRNGREHAYIRPLNDRVRRAIEEQVIGGLELEAGDV